MNKKRYFHYFVGILIAVGLYLLSSLFCSVVNALISINAGCETYDEFKLSGNLAGVLVVLVNSLCSHIFTAWVTVNAMVSYGIKRNCVTMRYFECSAVAIIVFAAIIIPAVLGSESGWITYISHAVSLELFAKRKCKKLNDSNTSVSSTEEQQEPKGVSDMNSSVNTEGVVAEITEDAMAETTENSAQDCPPENEKYMYCRKCGAKLPQSSHFCHKCGERTN